MGQNKDWVVFTFLTALMVILEGVTHASTPSGTIFSGIGASLIALPFWAIVGLSFFGGFVLLLNLFRSENKLKFSRLLLANSGIALGLILKLFFPSLP
jgi:hypothetical protein